MCGVRICSYLEVSASAAPNEQGVAGKDAAAVCAAVVAHAPIRMACNAAQGSLGTMPCAPPAPHADHFNSSRNY
jgi:hypothetical protein